MPSSYPTGFDAIPFPDFTATLPEGALGQPARPASEFMTDIVDSIKAIQTAVGTSTARGPLLSTVDANVLAADTTGLVDASASVQAWLNTLVTSGGTGYAPPGDYLLNSPVTAAGLNAATFAIRGAGIGVTRFIVPASNTSGGILLDATGSPKESKATVSDFSIVTQGVGQGTGFRMVVSSDGATHHRSIIMERVEICGEDVATDCFDIGIDLSGTYHPYLENVTFSGPWGTGITGRTDDANPQYTATAALVLDNAYGWYVKASQLWGAYTLVRDVGTNAESARIEDCQLVAGRVGIQRVRSGQEPHLQVENNHINCRDTALLVDGCRILFARGNHFYNTDDTSGYTGQPRDVWLRNTEMAVIGHNVFHFDGHPARINIDLDMTVDPFTNAAADKILITNNLFNADCANAIRIGVGASQVAIGINEYPGTFTKRVLDNSGVAAIFDVVQGSFRLTSQNSGTAVGPSFKIKRDSDTPAANDFLGEVEFSGNNSALAEKAYASIGAAIIDATAGTEDASLQVFTQIAGVATKVGTFNAPAAVGDSTAMLLLVKRSGVVAFERVTLGAVDSGGTGLRALVVPNS